LTDDITKAIDDITNPGHDITNGDISRLILKRDNANRIEDIIKFNQSFEFWAEDSIKASFKREELKKLTMMIEEDIVNSLRMKHTLYNL